MKKTFNYNGTEIVIEKLAGYGQYTINGYHCTDSTIWDYCDDDENPDKMELAQNAAYNFVINQ